MKPITLKPSMGAAVLARLRDYVSLPERGVVAGQSVASVLMDMLARGGGVINDIDVFVPTRPRKTREPSPPDAHLDDGFDPTKEHAPAPMPRFPRQTITTTYLTGTLCYDSYGHMMWIDTRSSYRVLRSRKHGLLNIVDCELTGDDSVANAAARIIDGFDLNCTRVGVDLVDGRMVWAPEFEFFLNTYQLQVATVQTPFHTAVRFAKKMAEMPVYGDIPLAMEIITATHAEWGTTERRDGGFDSLLYMRKRFGKTHAQQFRDHETVLAPYFDLQECGTDLYTLSPRQQPGEDMMKHITDVSYNWLRFGAQWSYGKRLRHSARLAPRVEALQEEGFDLFDEHLKLMGEQYLSGHVTQAHFRDVMRDWHKHPALAGVMAGMTLVEQRDAVLRLRRFAKNEGQWVYGVAENSATSIDLRSDDAFNAMLARERADFTTPLTTPLLPPDAALGPYRFVELNTRAELMEEGELMSHCVGGYASRVRSAGNHIFSIRRGPSRRDRSTVQIGDYGDTAAERFVSMQHCAFANNTPERDHKVALMYLTMWLNGSLPADHETLPYECRWRLADDRLIEREQEEALKAAQWRARLERTRQGSALGLGQPMAEDDDDIPF